MTIKERQEQIIEDFSVFGEWLDKYEYIIELGKSLPGLDDSKKTEDKLIKGCQSRVWLDCHMEDGKLWFDADSDALITRGIIALLTGVYSGATPQEILDDDFSFLDVLGLKENLSPTRSGGLAAMIATIKRKAIESKF
ncbi:MAG: SufE family protein [Bacteroidales bacterium]|nr:SufE family protein [Bacteroidales bacterium]